jgi:hypothetical protein
MATGLLPRPECRIRLDATMNAARAPMDASPADRREVLVTWAFARLDGRAFAAASAAIAGAFLLALTLFLVVKGAPPGVPVGPHLAELAAFFPGYTVSFGGAFVGALYAGVVGAVLGWLLAVVWNVAHSLVLAVIRVQASLATYSID